MLDLSGKLSCQCSNSFFCRLGAAVGKEDILVIVAKLVDNLVKRICCKNPDSFGTVDCNTVSPVNVQS